MTDTKPITCVTIIIVLLFFAGCQSPEAPHLPPPILVQVQAAKMVNYHMRMSYSGTIEESVSISLSFSVPGLVERVQVRSGQPVRKGQLLATLNGESFKNAFDLALAKQKQAEDAFQRFEPMFKNATMPKIKMVEIQTGLKQSIAATAIAKKNLSDCQLLAPADGIISQVNMEPGMNTQPGTPIMTLVQIENLYARFPVPENEISRINKEQLAEITIPAMGTAPLMGKIAEIGVIANPLSRSYDAKISLPNPSKNIRPGMLCNVRLVTSENTTVLVVPNQAVQVDEYGEAFVYVADLQQKKALHRKITIGPLLEEGITITAGLTAGEQIIVAGQHKLTHNAAITITQ